MCMQCSAEAVLVKSDVLPGYSLYRATKDTHGWPLGWFGVVQSNDPEFVFKGEVMLDPCDGLTEDDLDAMPEYPEGYDEFAAVADELSNIEFSSPWRAYEFVKTCIEHGYDPKVHGYQLGYWLTNYMGQKLQEA